jgi:hypothetical protein
MIETTTPAITRERRDLKFIIGELSAIAGAANLKLHKNSASDNRNACVWIFPPRFKAHAMLNKARSIAYEKAIESGFTRIYFFPPSNKLCGRSQPCDEICGNDLAVRRREPNPGASTIAETFKCFGLAEKPSIAIGSLAANIGRDFFADSAWTAGLVVQSPSTISSIALRA